MSNIITLLGLRDLRTDEQLQDNKDYGIFLNAALYSVEKLTDSDDLKYRLKITHVEQIIDLKEKQPVEFEKGKSPSQKLRWRVTEKLGDEEYPNFMDYLLSRIDGITEDYIENLKN